MQSRRAQRAYPDVAGPLPWHLCAPGIVRLRAPRDLPPFLGVVAHLQCQGERDVRAAVIPVFHLHDGELAWLAQIHLEPGLLLSLCMKEDAGPSAEAGSLRRPAVSRRGARAPG